MYQSTHNILKKLEELPEKSKMFHKLNELEKEYKFQNIEKNEDNREKIIERTKGLFTWSN